MLGLQMLGEKINVALDHDGGGDDYIALLALASNPQVSIKAITVESTGEVRKGFGAQITADLCHHFNLSDIPIAEGPGTPISKRSDPTLPLEMDEPTTDGYQHFPKFIRNYVGKILGRDSPADGHPNPKFIEAHSNPTAVIQPDAVALLRKTIADCKARHEKLSILATGPLTNIALLLQQHGEEVEDTIKEIVMMGGAVEVPGNVHDLWPTTKQTRAECNIAADPDAARIVFASKVPLRLVPVDVTNKVPLTEEYYNALKNSDLPVHQFMYLLLKDVRDLVKDAFFKIYFLWDPLAAILLMNPTLGESKTVKLSINPTTWQPEPDENGKAVTVFFKMIPSPKALWDDLAKAIGAHIKTAGQKLKEIAELGRAFSSPQADFAALSSSSVTPHFDQNKARDRNTLRANDMDSPMIGHKAHPEVSHDSSSSSTSSTPQVAHKKGGLHKVSY